MIVQTIVLHQNLIHFNHDILPNAISLPVPHTERFYRPVQTSIVYIHLVKYDSDLFLHPKHYTEMFDWVMTYAHHDMLSLPAFTYLSAYFFQIFALSNEGCHEDVLGSFIPSLNCEGRLVRDLEPVYRTVMKVRLLCRFSYV